jgi:predicted PurR-regulated permease PerM
VHTVPDEQLTTVGPAAPAPEAGRTSFEISISVRTILLTAGVAAIAWALSSIASVLLVLFVAVFSIAVLSPVVSAMERRLGWSRRLAATALVAAIVVVLAVVVTVVVTAMVDAVREFGDALPQLVEAVKRTDVGSAVDNGGGSLETLERHTGEITSGVARVSGGVADVGVSAFGAVTLVFSVLFLTLFGLMDEPRMRGWVGRLLDRGDRERVLQVADRIVQTTSRYMLGNLAISLVCGTVYGVTAVVLDVPYPLALAVIAAILDLIPSIGATIAGVVVAIAAAPVGLGTLVAFLIVIVVYQQVENYVLQPAIIGRAARISGFTVLASVLVFGALFGLVGAVIGVPLAAAIQIVVDELTEARRARIAAADASAEAVAGRAAATSRVAAAWQPDPGQCRSQLNGRSKE